MSVSYDLDLVVLSVAVAIMGSYTAMDLAGRTTDAGKMAARAWLAGGALALGVGLWSMHFIGTLALHTPGERGYDPALTALSLLIAVLVSGFALALVSGRHLGGAKLLAGGLIAGSGMAAMNYTGMAALRMQPAVRYDRPLFAASLLVAVLGSMIVLWLSFRLRSEAPGRRIGLRLAGALAMGAAFAGMEYTGMAAARFAPDSLSTAALQVGANGTLLAYGVGLTVLVLLLLTALVTVFDLRLAWHSARMLRESERANAQLKREIAEKEHTRQLLRESEQMYRAVLNTTTDAVVLVDEMAVIRYANPAVEQLFGYKPQELVGKTLGLLQPEDLLRPHRLGFGRYLGSGVRKLDWRATETRGRHRDGRDIPLELALGEIALDGKRLFAGFMRDISERKEREKRIARLTRVYAVLSGINGLIVRVRSRRDLFEGACRIAVKDGGFRMAMISLVEGGALRPVASHGIDEGYSQQLHVRLDADDHLGRGPAGTALRDRQARVCNDIANDPDMAPWREAALQRGYRSSATLPLIAGGDLVGCLGLYAAEPRSFDQEEIRLLSELAGDISYALEVIARDERLDYLAYYDPLTQLANQKLFGQRLERMLDAARQRREPLALLVLDLSRFKAVNDVLGHGGGDAVLKLIADRLVSFAGDPEYLARMSGDRFALVIPELGPDGLPPARLARLAVQLGRPINMLGQELRISARTGIALFPDNGADVESLVRNAEAALKMAKHGRESFLFYTPQMSATISLDLSLDSKLRQALEHKEFVVHYQPKIDLDSGSISGAEALIRWHSPQLGTVPPERFVPLLEETGMILEAGRWMMETAAADRARWLRQGLQAPRIAVNVSPVQLRKPDFVETVGSALGLGYSGDAGVDLEVTESMLMTDAAIDKLKRLRQLGLDIAIDDFGTGYSSLAYLARLPVSSIKIDRSFIVGMSEDTDTSNIVAAIIALAHSINLRVVAEGVESPAQLKRLRLLGCDEVQGFLFSAGVPAEAFARMLREERKLALA